MLLDDAHNQLGWPEPEQVLEPSGTGARVYADYAKQKVGDVLRRSFPGLHVQAGVLSADPSSRSTEAPIAIVCQFPRGASDEVLDEAHRLAWNFSRAALLITLEPHRLIAWSCCQHPKEDVSQRRVCELPMGPESTSILPAQQRAVADLLHWISLLTGQLLRQRPEQFRPEGRADSLLLQNLRYIRRQLLDNGMPERYCHDLLARVIFTQFLFHRRDGDGRPFFDDRLLEGRCEGALRRAHTSLASILREKSETYALFRWLDDRFNGDLFPGKADQSDAERERAWQEEKDAVTEHRLGMLADFVSGRVDLSKRQPALWPLYSFDTIPLEFISSVYEEFLSEEKLRDKAYYTRPHLVDFVLDGVLPWEGEEWNVRVLDPSCGSGIFLVKAFQRLIHRWRTAHPGQDPLVSDLKPILANNLVGVDKNPEAVRVACFSLYLAMADAIEPKYYLKREKVFPRLRDTRLLGTDFFDEATEGIRSEADAGTYHFVVGNAPWGDNSIKSSSAEIEADAGPGRRKKELITNAERWAKDHDWPVANNDIGPLFLGKAAILARSDGRIAMVQPASTLLHQRAGPAERLRRKLFTEHTVEEITNLTAVRRDVFTEAIGPACVVTFGTAKPDPSRRLLYCAPKPQPGNSTQRALVIEPQDTNQITHAEAANEPLVWTVFALGGRRDWSLLQRLRSLPTLEKLEQAGCVTSRLGVIPGNQERELKELKGKPYFEAASFPESSLLELDGDSIPRWEKPLVASSDSTDIEAFKKPQMLIKQSFSAKEGRYRAARVRTSDPVWGVVCKKTYLAVRDLTPDAGHVRAAVITYNSRFAAYFLNLTSSRALYNTELLSEEVRSLPLPNISADCDPRSFLEIDEVVQKVVKLNAAEATLIDDFLDVTLPGLLRKKPGPAYQATSREGPGGGEPQLAAYARTFVRVVKSTFGEDKAVCATVFQESAGKNESERLPVRMVGVHFDWPGRASLTIEPLESDVLHKRLQRLYADALRGKGRASPGEGLGFQRVAFLFHTHQAPPHGRVRSLYIIKPDECRYWTRSLSMRDADHLSAAILKAAGRKPPAA
jgi:hypothetical protein